ncbi:hypothetical protein POM88_033294 [Heracleum sosnowskyi]|uniref:Elongation factor G-like domain-containing protein n=1 Tax=Heracleum sosnowskyi TaxID=360622 RepID=A0AAD8MKV8_9APIA|nr:hypothetical protein POM88_033294 [Heracleum sosnowskyi]
MANNKSPDPDGFTPEFFVLAWPVIHNESQVLDNVGWVHFGPNRGTALDVRSLLSSTRIEDHDSIYWNDLRAKWVTCSSIYHSIPAAPPPWIIIIWHSFAIPRCSINLWPAQGYVVEARLDRGRGPSATTIVKAGTLVCRQHIVVGAEWGRVHASRDTTGKFIEQASPAMPVEIEGLKGLPNGR